jgi:ferric-dicitrate binding protein FerR (iron transport regulator)
MPDSELPVGALLRAGQELNLIEGRALVTFVSGAQIVLEGPTQMRLDSPMATELAGGRITASVPTQAIGFSVSSPMARFVDLGTEFTLNQDVDKGFVLQVFDGLVEVQLPVRDGDASQKPLRISELTAVRFHAGSGKIVVEPYDESERLSL